MTVYFEFLDPQCSLGKSPSIHFQSALGSHVLFHLNIEELTVLDSLRAALQLQSDGEGREN